MFQEITVHHPMWYEPPKSRVNVREDQNSLFIHNASLCKAMASQLSTFVLVLNILSKPVAGQLRIALCVVAGECNG